MLRAGAEDADDRCRRHRRDRDECEPEPPAHPDASLRSPGHRHIFVIESAKPRRIKMS